MIFIFNKANMGEKYNIIYFFKKKRNVLLFLIILIVIFVCAGDLYTKKESQVAYMNWVPIKIGVPIDAKPYSYLNSNDEVIGYNVDTYNLIAKERGFTIKWYTISEDTDVAWLLENKIIDCVLGVDLKKYDMGEVLMSESLSKNKMSIFIKNYKTTINNFGDLKNKKISVYRKDPTIKSIDNMEGARIFKADDIEGAVALMFNGTAEAYVGERLSSIKYIYNSIYRDKVKLIGERECEWLSSIMTIPEKKDIIDYINTEIAYAKQKGMINEQEIIWFGESLDNTSKFFKQLTAISAIAVLVLGLVVGLIYRLNFILRREVKERTAKINEEKLLKEEIIKTLFDGVLFLDTKGKILLENQAAKTILADDNMVNCSFFELKAARCFNVEDIYYVLDTKKEIIKKEVCYIDNGKETDLEYNIMPVISTEGILQGITLSFRDVTDEKRMMQKIVEKDKMESLGRLTAGIAHEIRNPLTSIDMYIKLLPEKMQDARFRSDMLEDIPREIKRLNNMVKNLLDYSKPAPSHKEEIDVSMEIEFVGRLLQSELSKNNIQLEVLAEKGICIYFDRQQLKQILINLLLNAADALKDIEEPKIKVSFNCEVGYNYLSVCDNGTGISEKNAEHIFEPFFSTKTNSYGLGLSIVGQLAKENNSDIYIDKTYCEGARFVLKVPINNRDEEGMEI